MERVRHSIEAAATTPRPNSSPLINKSYILLSLTRNVAHESALFKGIKQQLDAYEIKNQGHSGVPCL